mmetsp:Transcript_22857/g.16168  ORF Transcript_22857/g.16168 Transcript_22857/m.16168 type:complete len:131 (-) Transcript_22857:454-846(-)
MALAGYKTFDQIKKEAGSKDVALIRDKNIYWIVFNRKDTQWDFKTLLPMVEILDILEKCEDNAYVVTISTSPKVFHSGFNTKFWAESVFNVFKTEFLFYKIVERFLKLPMPTLCCITGHCFGGGLFYAFA